MQAVRPAGDGPPEGTATIYKETPREARDVWGSLSSGCGCHLAPAPLKIPNILYMKEESIA